ncbi:winged helix-turn-helix transcriptional regulator [Cellulomonas fengjieae]|uniref:winged helix-turn-helix transcriptional regulator n=1 Tax=Cellulomonas fengjieae TaxID=2819978 RepID=UPI001AAFDD78|nr:helix-turn-helix domain-containing protein [Cellulomonas fengjieae]MBO3100466.1 helix-turn-helix transcriptional regulator [Cellulomonas fengjieae]
MSDLMENREGWSTANCSIARALEVVGTRAAVLILREAFFGTRRFDDFARRVGISEPVAAARLKELTAAGVLERVPYQEPGQRTRFEYQLTEKGRALQPVITALRQWGDAWGADPAGPPVVAVHRDCGAAVGVRVRCDAGHDVAAGQIEYQPGSGLVFAS